MGKDFGQRSAYRAIISSDWNECLAPCGPFDVFAFHYPHLGSDFNKVFKQYTGNVISLSDAVKAIRKLVPEPITAEQMDAYLEDAFVTYRGVPELIAWCLERGILFMVNTTGMLGYFQRVFSKALLPLVPVISANPMILYPALETDPPEMHDLFEIDDKGKNTELVIHTFGIPPKRTILMGDSGGDGPHFEWGARQGAFLIGSMAKPSLTRFCQERGLKMGLRFGLSYTKGEKRDLEREMGVDFMDLSSLIAEVLEDGSI
jgi:2-hydroxy-3-keto-5-methylthiopentenyl-1-phosphate phosphatase